MILQYNFLTEVLELRNTLKHTILRGIQSIVNESAEMRDIGCWTPLKGGYGILDTERCFYNQRRREGGATVLRLPRPHPLLGHVVKDFTKKDIIFINNWAKRWTHWVIFITSLREYIGKNHKHSCLSYGWISWITTYSYYSHVSHAIQYILAL